MAASIAAAAATATAHLLVSCNEKNATEFISMHGVQRTVWYPKRANVKTYNSSTVRHEAFFPGGRFSGERKLIPRTI